MASITSLPLATSTSLLAKPDALPEPHGLVGGFQALHAHDGRHDESGFRSRGGIDAGLRARGQLGSGVPLILRRSREFVERRFVGHHGHLRPEFGDLPRQQLDIPAGDQGMDSKAVRPAPHDIQSAGADGPGGAEEREKSHPRLYDITDFGLRLRRAS